MQTINVPAYWEYTLNLTPAERQHRDMLMDWLPDELVDSHAHANLPEHVVALEGRAFNHMFSTFPYLSVGQSQELQRTFFPGKRVRALRFAHAFRGIDHRAANDYLCRASPPEDRVALYGLPDDIEYTVAELRTGRYAALKMYYMYLDPPGTEIYQYFRPEILEETQALDVPIILHLPKRITQCLPDLLRLLEDFPRLTVVLAHLGLTKMPIPGLREAYAAAAAHQRVFMDTAMVPSGEVVRMAIDVFGDDRILFGSDEPVNMIRATAYEHPELGQRLVTAYPYHWVNLEEQERFRHLADGVTHALWPALQAVREAVESLPVAERDRAKESVFSGNAKRVYGF